VYKSKLLSVSYAMEGWEITRSAWDAIMMGFANLHVSVFRVVGDRWWLRYYSDQPKEVIISRTPVSTQHRKYHLLLKLEDGCKPVYHLNRMKPRRNLRNCEYLGTVYLSVR
jgi:hypothetical protein